MITYAVAYAHINKNHFPPIIGFTGKALAGKSTIAKIVAAAMRDASRHVPFIEFSDRLKASTAGLFHLDPVLLDDQTVKAMPFHEFGGLTPRAHMQWLGKHMRDTCGEDVWVRCWQQDVVHWADNLADGTVKIVTTSVRYDNEAIAVKRFGGIVIEVRRQGSGLSGGEAEHESERGISQNLVDFTADNDHDDDGALAAAAVLAFLAGSVL